MTLLRDLSLRYKIVLLPGIGIVGFVAIFIIGAVTNLQQHQLVHDVERSYVPALELYRAVEVDLAETSTLLRLAASLRDRGIIKKADLQFKKPGFASLQPPSRPTLRNGKLMSWTRSL